MTLMQNLNSLIVKGRCRELGLTYADVAEQLAALAGTSITVGYVSHIVNGRREARHLWPYLARVLRAPIAFLTCSGPREFSERYTHPDCS